MTEYKCAARLEHFQTGIFAALTARREALQRAGKKLYNLYIGTPDFPPAPHVVQALAEAAQKPENYKYALIDLPELLEAVTGYYKTRFGVEVRPEQILSVNGSQEGIGHLGLALCDPGDVVLLPDPGYPIFETGAYLGGAAPYFYPLLRANRFLPDLSAVPEEVLHKTKYMVVSYPSNPVGAAAPASMYEELIAYAKKYHFIIVNDNAYSDILFDGREGISFLSLPGAQEVGVEFFSLSKSFNVTGCRVSFCIGNRQVVDALRLLRSQYDFGMFLPIQYAAIAALTGPREMVVEQCAQYRRRRDALCGGLRELGWEVPDSDGTMFVWAPVPPKFKTSMACCNALMEQAGVLCTPGNAFGANGEGYVRFALVLPPEQLREAVAAIDRSGVLK